MNYNFEKMGYEPKDGTKVDIVPMPIETTSAKLLPNPLLPAVFSATEMLSFGYFLRDNFYVDGSPKLKSYNTNKYPHSLMPEIFNYWCLANGSQRMYWRTY